MAARFFKFCCILVGISLLQSCKEKVTSNLKVNTFIAIDSAINAICSTTDQTSWQLINKYNNLYDTIFYNEPDWENWLLLLKEADINKPALKNNYKIDSVENKIVYTAIEKSLRTRYLQFGFNDKKQITWISALLISNNLLYKSNYQISLVKGKGLKISGSQALFFGKKASFELNYQPLIVHNNNKTTE